MPRRVKPRSPRLAGDHPQARALLRAYTLNENGGSSIADVASRQAGTLQPGTGTLASMWGTGDYGPHLAFAAAASQYADCGAIPELASASRVTLVGIVRRSAASADVSFGNVSSGALSGISFEAFTDGNIYVACDNAGSTYGQIASNVTDWMHVAIVYDGTATGNSNRLKLYINGALQPLTYTGTIPATLGTTQSNFHIGHNTANGVFSTCQVAELLIYAGRALTAGAVGSLYRDIWGMFGVAPFRRSLLGTGTLAGPPPPPATVAFSAESPASGSTQQPYDGAIGVTATLTDPLNPITARTAAVNGFTVNVAHATLSSVSERLTTRGPVRAGAPNTVVWTVTTQDGTVNTETVAFTARRAFDRCAATADAMILRPASVDALATAAIVAGSRVDALADMAATALGQSGSTDALSDMAVVPDGTGLLNATPGEADFLATEFEQATLLPVSALTGEYHEQRIPVTAVVQGTVRDEMPLSALVSGTTVARGVPVSAETVARERLPLLALSVLAGTYGQGCMPVSAEVEEVRAQVVFELFVASLTLQEVESE